MRILVKIGGAQLEEPHARAAFASSVAAAQAEGHELVIVHGGGNQIHALAQRLGLATSKVDGLRVTDAATAEICLAVLGGTVNRTLVGSLGSAGVSSVGLTGADGGLMSVRSHRPGGRDLGYVGEVSQVDTGVVEALLAAGLLPVVASVAPLSPLEEGPRDHLYNVNADTAAAPLASALGADAVLFLTDVPAVLDGSGTPITSLDCEQAGALRSQGVLGGGMLPKLDAAFAAALARPEALVRIAPAAGENAINGALADGIGTTLLAGAVSHG